MLVDALRNDDRVSELPGRLGLARSSYFSHRSPMRIADKYAQVRRMITNIFEDNHRSYGYCRIQASLSRQRVFLSEKVVQHLMKQERLQAARPTPLMRSGSRTFRNFRSLRAKCIHRR